MQAAFDDVEEFVLVLMLMPVIVALHDAEADDGIIYVTEGLVEPGRGAASAVSFSSMSSRGLYLVSRTVM